MSRGFGIAALLDQPERTAMLLLFASLRTGTALALLPGIGAMLVPLRVRIGLAAATGALVLATQPLALPADVLGLRGLALVAGELLIGASAGLLIQVAFAAATVTGELLSQAMGLGFATILDPGGASSPVLATFFGLLMWLVFLGSDGHLRLFALLVDSYAVLPPGSDPLGNVGGLAQFGAAAFVNGLMVALPVAGALLLVNLLLAVMARSAPQLNLFAIGFPAMLAAGVVALPLALPAMAGTMAGGIERLFDALAGVLG